MPMFRILSLGKTPEEHDRQLLMRTCGDESKHAELISKSLQLWSQTSAYAKENSRHVTFLTVTLPGVNRLALAKDSPAFKSFISTKVGSIQGGRCPPFTQPQQTGECHAGDLMAVNHFRIYGNSEVSNMFSSSCLWPGENAKGTVYYCPPLVGVCALTLQ